MWRQKQFDCAVVNLNKTIVNEKLILLFEIFEFGGKVHFAFGFFLKNKEDGGFSFFYAHEYETLLDRSKVACTKDDLAKLKDILNKIDLIESCSREGMNTKCSFYKMTNLTVFAASFKDVPMGCKDAVLPEAFSKNHTVNCRLTIK